MKVACQRLPDWAHSHRIQGLGFEVLLHPIPPRTLSSCVVEFSLLLLCILASRLGLGVESQELLPEIQNIVTSDHIRVPHPRLHTEFLPLPAMLTHSRV